MTRCKWEWEFRQSAHSFSQTPHRQIIDATDEQVDDFLDYMERTVPVADEDTIRSE